MINNALSIYIISCFLVTNLIGPNPVYAQDFRLPAPGVMVRLSPEFSPPILKGIKVHPDNPFRFDFILDKGEMSIKNQEQLKQESTKLIKYFLASLTIPEKDLWVNLSPYEKTRIVPQSFGLTEMGRDLLAEDYMLKQITASLIYPEDEVGKKFWKRVYEEASKRYGSTNVPVDTFNKVWILPQEAEVYENAEAGTAYIVKSKLKVMLEQDYLSLQKHEGIQSSGNVIPRESPALGGIPLKAVTGIQETSSIGSQVVREIVIPELTREVNADKNFAQLRQVYNSLILATWYKKKIKDSILSQVYAGRNKVSGVSIDDPHEKDRIYQRYLQAFKKGVYNYIKEEIDSSTQKVIPRKYFSGGTTFNDEAMNAAFYLVSDKKVLAGVSIDAAMVIEINAKPFTGESQNDFVANPGHAKRVWETTDIRHHRRDRFIYTIKINRLNRLLRPGSNADFYSASVIDQDNMSSLSEGRIGLILEFPDDDLLGVLNRMDDHEINTKTYSLENFFNTHRLKNAANVLFDYFKDKVLKVTPQLLMDRSKQISGRDAGNNEIIVKNTANLKIKAVVLMVKNGISLESTLNIQLHEEASKEVLEDIKNGRLPVVIIGDREARLDKSAMEDAINAFKRHFPEAKQLDGQTDVFQVPSSQMQKDMATTSNEDIFYNSKVLTKEQMQWTLFNYFSSRGRNPPQREMLNVEWIDQGNETKIVALGNDAYRITKNQRPLLDPEEEKFKILGNDELKITPKFIDSGFVTADSGHKHKVVVVERVFGQSLKHINGPWTKDELKYFADLLIRMAANRVKCIDFKPANFMIGHINRNGEQLGEGAYLIDVGGTRIIDSELEENVLNFYIDRLENDTEWIKFHQSNKKEVIDRLRAYLSEKKKVAGDLKGSADNERADNAMAVDQKGGIDLTPANMNLQMKNNGGEIKFHLNVFGQNITNSKQLGLLLQQLQNAPGFVPVIINIEPLKNFSEFLGLS